MGDSPFFFIALQLEVCAHWLRRENYLQLLELIEKSVALLGYELVDYERGPRGLLRVYIDFFQIEGRRSGISLDDCEKVSRQLTHVLMVENVEYERLEVSSPGLDRPLRKLADFVRFDGCEVKLQLRAPSKVFENRKSFSGVLDSKNDDSLKLRFAVEGGEQVLEFMLADVDKARLVPKLDFGGRRA